MQLQASTRIAFPRALAFRTWRDGLADAVPFMPNVASVVLKQRTERDGAVELVNLWTGKADLPAPARRLVRPEMLSWTDFALWDEAGFSCRWHLKTHALPEALECSGQTTFLEAGPEATTVDIAGSLVLHLDKTPLPRLLSAPIGPLLERIIVSAVKPNLLSGSQAVEKLLLSRQQAPGAQL